MILRAAIVFLLVLNLGVAAWWLAAGNIAPSQPATALTSSEGAPRLRLLSEAVPAKPTAPAPADGGSVAVADEATNQSQVMPAATSAASCLRFGPFTDAAARDAARPALQRLAEQVVARETQGKSTRGWRVYMPAQASRDAAKAVVEQIKAAGINDWYIIANGDEANSIALGRYGGEDSARRREAQLAAKGFIARAEPLGDTPPQWWLDARLPAGANLTALALVALSKPLDCATLR